MLHCLGWEYNHTNMWENQWRSRTSDVYVQTFLKVFDEISCEGKIDELKKSGVPEKYWAELARLCRGLKLRVGSLSTESIQTSINLNQPSLGCLAA